MRAPELIAVLLLASASAGAAEGPVQALREGSFSLGLRYRFERVEDDAARFGGRAAESSTLRTLLGYRSAELRGFSVRVAAENVSRLGFEERVGNDRPPVADPEITELLEVYGQWRRQPGEGREHRVRLGRQEIDHADQRFLGAVGWRQHHQTFDAVTVAVSPRRGWRLFYAYFDRVHTVTGVRSPMGTHFASATAGLAGLGELEAFALWLDYDRFEQRTSSTRTLGARWSGVAPLPAALEVSWDVAAARQDELADNPGELGLWFGRLELDLATECWSLGAGIELLEGDGASAFQTPLATLHKFNGFADRFLVTPADGLEDLYAMFTISLGAWSGTLAYHEFDAERGGRSYGDEVDAQVRWVSPWQQTFALELARFDSDGFSSDVEKWFLWTSWSL